MCSPSRLLEVLRLGSVPMTLSIQILACIRLKGKKNGTTAESPLWHRQKKKKRKENPLSQPEV